MLVYARVCVQDNQVVFFGALVARDQLQNVLIEATFIPCLIGGHISRMNYIIVSYS